MFYRVTVWTTDDLQPPGRSITSWTRQVVYSGLSFEDARVAYVRELPQNQGGAYGEPARRTVMEQFTSEPEDIREPSDEVKA